MHATRSLSGLYIILDPLVYPARLLVDVLRTAADAGAFLFQYRNKTASMKDAYMEALALRELRRRLASSSSSMIAAIWPWPSMPMVYTWGREICLSTWQGR